MGVDVEEMTVPRAAAWALMGAISLWGLAAVLVSATSTPPWAAAVGGLLAVAAAHWRIQWALDRRLAATWGQRRAARWMTWGIGVLASAWLTWALAAGTVISGGIVVSLLLLAVVAWGVLHPLLVSLPEPVAPSPDGTGETGGTGRTGGVRTGTVGTGDPSDPSAWQPVLDLKGVSVRVVGVERFAAGYTASVAAVEGDLDVLFGAKTPDRIATAAGRQWPDLQVAYGSVVIERGLTAGTAQVRLLTRDVLAQERLRPASSEPVSIQDPWCPGEHLDGSRVEISLRGHGQMIGASQSGKSTTMQSAIEHVARCSDAVPLVGGSWKLADLVSPWLADLESGQSLRTPFGWLSPTAISAMRLLAAMWQYADHFFSTPASQRPTKPTREWPAYVVFLDEVHRLIESRVKITCHDGVTRDASALIEALTSGATGAFVYLVLASQRGTTDHFGMQGGSIKANLTWHMAFRSADPADLGRVIPDVTYGMTNVNLTHPGTAYVKVGKRSPMLAKMEKLRSIPASARAVAGLGGTWPSWASDVLTVADNAFADRWKSSPEEFLAYVYSGKEPASPAPIPTAEPAVSPGVQKMREATARLQRSTARRRLARELTDERIGDTLAALETLPVLDAEPGEPAVPATPTPQAAPEPPPAAPEPAPPAAPARRLPQPLQAILDAIGARPDLVLTTASGAQMVAAKDLITAIGKARHGDTPAIAREGAALTRELKKRWGIESEQAHIPGRGTVRGYLVSSLRKAGEQR
ncbi:hypothetical protein [Actinoalloteichus sp. GBA129-24]|uniref:hypothetical protein n=1 Tax=Actinoalloteichus sp. GBA129-24 TaxID=1612551 RepID=UPI0009503F9A|nr:hypothetical protein [Actinoalloteichus sp. GBA129-24]APU20975.1 hypothetical protein UA75_14825 [Actinoalloteichus sp. GBA129-24]APU24224.1 hypothetical protein UA75_31305 [Actinoalloteichus sp. GBA129-24]